MNYETLVSIDETLEHLAKILSEGGTVQRPAGRRAAPKRSMKSRVRHAQRSLAARSPRGKVSSSKRRKVAQRVMRARP